MIMFDAHCHLQDERLAASLDADIQQAGARGVSGWSCCGVEESDWDAVARLAASSSGVRPSFGLHPWFVAKRSPLWERHLRDALRDYPSAGVGEIGLDHALKERNDADQLSVFETQFRFAQDLGRAVSIHCRRAWGALLDSLSRLGPHEPGFVVHSFSGSHELIPQLVRLGGYFSVSGSITFSHNRRGRRSAAAVPEARLLIETDAPDLPPMRDGVPPERGTVNRPENLTLTLDAMAEIRDMPRDAVAGLTWRNAVRLFGGDTGS